MNSEVIGETGELKHVNRYGFFGDACKRSWCVLGDRTLELSSDPVLENQRLRKWMEMLKNWNTFGFRIGLFLKDIKPKRRTFCRDGSERAFPTRCVAVCGVCCYRRMCAPIFITVGRCEWQRVVEYYDNCLSKEMEEDDPFTSKGGVIDRDINRTYPQNEAFSEIGGVGQESLRRVLIAFANHNKEVVLWIFVHCRSDTPRE